MSSLTAEVTETCVYTTETLLVQATRHQDASGCETVAEYTSVNHLFRQLPDITAQYAAQQLNTIKA